MNTKRKKKPMDAETKKQAIAHVLEKTKDRNYRKHINADMMTIILRDVFTCMDEWEGPKRVSGEH